MAIMVVVVVTFNLCTFVCFCLGLLRYVSDLDKGKALHFLFIKA